MVVTIGCRDEGVRAGAGVLAREESHHLERYFRQILEVDWHIAHVRHEYVVTCTVHTNNDKLAAVGRADTLSHGILEASRMIQAQRTKAKRRRLSERHDPLLAIR
jgi:ribosome-associated translation inhibitor RaiA